MGRNQIKHVSTSTVGRGKAVRLADAPQAGAYREAGVDLTLGNSLDAYERWPAPMVIVSDGAYGVLGFEGDTSDHLGMPDW